MTQGNPHEPKPVIPWALSRVSEIPDTVQLGYTSVDIDPATQTARYWDAHGMLVEPIEAGKHGSIRNTSKATATGGDGSGRNPRTDNDTHYDATRD